jgi:hypothetical protein
LKFGEEAEEAQLYQFAVALAAELVEAVVVAIVKYYYQ